MPRRLTGKQAAFANAVIEGMRPSDAYRHAYDCEASNPATVSRHAMELLKDARIAALIEKGKDDAAKRASWNRTKAIQRLSEVNDTAYWEIAEKGVNSRERIQAFLGTSDRLNDLLGATNGGGQTVLIVDDISGV